MLTRHTQAEASPDNFLDSVLAAGGGVLDGVTGVVRALTPRPKMDVQASAQEVAVIVTTQDEGVDANHRREPSTDASVTAQAVDAPIKALVNELREQLKRQGEELEGRCNELAEEVQVLRSEVTRLSTGGNVQQASKRQSHASKRRSYHSNEIKRQASGLLGRFSIHSMADRGANLKLEQEHEAFSVDAQLSDSVWEAPLLLGRVNLGSAAEAWVCSLVVFNIVVQGFFVYVIWNHLVVKPIDDEKIASYADWRLSVAHDYKYTMIVAGEVTSMARQVCGKGSDGSADETLIASTGQADAHGTLVEYLGTDGAFIPGQALCIFALLVWFMTVYQVRMLAASTTRVVMPTWAPVMGTCHGQLAPLLLLHCSHEDCTAWRLHVQEIRGCLRLIVAIARLPIGDGALEMDGGDLVCANTTMRSKVCFLLLQALRVGAAVLLCHVGAEYLVDTIDLGELILVREPWI